MSSNEIELPLQPSPNAVVNEPARLGDRAAGAAVAKRLKGAAARAKAAAAAARRRLVRASLEARAVARSSAALSGLTADFARVRGAAGQGAASSAEGLKGAREDVKRVARALANDADHFASELPGELKRLRAGAAQRAHALAARLRSAEDRGKKAAMRSRTISGLAIDSQRIAKRVREARERRRMAH